MLSEPQIIETVNEFFIPLAINVTKEGFPMGTIPALKMVEQVYQTNWR